MQHPLGWISSTQRTRFFTASLALTSFLFLVLAQIDQPLRNPSAPNGIVSFELAGTRPRADQILSSWQAASSARAHPNKTTLFAAFSLGIDYLFMPSYALTLALGSLLAAGGYAGRMSSIGAAAGYGAFAAALFDAVENYALWQMLIGLGNGTYPALAAFCAIVKFGLIVLVLLYCLIAWLLPRVHLLQINGRED